MAHQEIMDGNAAAAYIAYQFSQVAGIYPITPSSGMGELVDIWQAEGRKNLFGEKMRVVEMQSEAGVAGFIHGSLKSGALTTTFTSSQGLLLMLPNMYKIAGELLPTVFHVAARSVSTNALSIFGDHSDVMAVRQSGFALLSEGSVQEVMDLAAVAHLATLECSVPFVNFFDGFLTSHETQKINVLQSNDLKKLINQEALEIFQSRGMNPNHPTVSGTNQGPDLYFQQRETVNRNYQVVPFVVQKYMKKINELQGTNYDLVQYYGHPEAQEVIIVMGSVSSTVQQVVDHLIKLGRKVGMIQVHLYRPFPVACFLEKLPDTVHSIAVLDRTKEPGALGEPLYLDVQAALYDCPNRPRIIGGRFGIGSKDTTPAQIIAVFKELQKEDPKKHFTIGIEDDVTKLSLEIEEEIDLTPSDTYQVKFWGLGGDGTVSMNRSTIHIIGEKTDKQVQAYFYFDSRKREGVTISHLRFGQNAIKSTYLTQQTDFIGITMPAYLQQYDVLEGLKPGGIFLLNTPWNKEQLERRLPAKMKKFIANNHIEFYTINACKIAQEAGLTGKFSISMQAAFFKLTGVLPFNIAQKAMEDKIVKAFSKKSELLVSQNLRAIALSIDALEKITIPPEWGTCEDRPKKQGNYRNHFKKQIQEPFSRLKGSDISVGQLIDNGMVAGSLPLGGTATEKKSLSWEVPEWDPAYCVQCGLCSFVCPHAAIRPFLVEEDELNVAPEGYQVKDFKGKDGLMYRIQVSVEDCTGCELCVKVCPSKGKALKMISSIENEKKLKEEAINWAFSMTLRAKENPGKPGTVAYTQFEQPLLEFSGACGGCGETPYVKLLTQMFGDRMVVANATGCSSIWGALGASTPYTTNQKGCGPAWSNSLLEDNAEFGYGMMVANDTRRKSLIKLMEEAKNEASHDLSLLMNDWIEHFGEGKGTRARAAKLQQALEKECSETTPVLNELYSHKDLFVKPSQWIVGGDGWAYDIGYGGLDHVLASGADVNILVLDNEVYSNTGGHLSKGTPTAAIAKFSAAGNRSTKKDLGMLAMTYGNVYVAQVANGANPIQVIKAFEEAENYPGPSIIIAYVPCITHRLEGGMSRTIEEAKEAVNSGYWSLYRFNPSLIKENKCPMILDFKHPKFENMIPFILKQERFSALQIVNKKEAEKLYQLTVEQARRRFLNYAKLSGDYDSFLKKESKNKKFSNAIDKQSESVSNISKKQDEIDEILKTLDI